MHILAIAAQKNGDGIVGRQKTSERGKRQAAQDNVRFRQTSRLTQGAALHGKARRLPIRKSALEPAGSKALALQDRHRIKRQGAIGVAAIGDDFASGRQFGKASFKFFDRNVGG